MFTPRQLTDFQTDAFNFLVEFEELVRRVYDDGKGVPTIGVGYALVVRVNGVWTLREGLEDDLAAVGISLTPEDIALLGDVVQILNNSALTSEQKSAEVQALGITRPNLDFSGSYPEESVDDSSLNNVFSFEVLGDQQVHDLFNNRLQDDALRLRTALGSYEDDSGSVYDSLVSSRELLALTSLFYNAESLIGSKLKAALQHKDRAEAWYEIRYNSNSLGKTYITTGRFPSKNNIDQGIATRRFAESELFGLYNDAANVSEADAKHAYRMFTRHRDYITQYEAAYGATPDGSVGSRDGLKGPGSNYFRDLRTRAIHLTAVNRRRLVAIPRLCARSGCHSKLKNNSSLAPLVLFSLRNRPQGAPECLPGALSHAPRSGGPR